MQTCYVGVDVGLDTMDVAVATLSDAPQAVDRYPNDRAGWQALVTQMEQVARRMGCRQLHLIVEPTGGYEAGLCDFVVGCGWAHTRVNPQRVRRLAEGQGRRAKTDRQDALLLAGYGALLQPDTQQLMAEGAGELDELLRRQADVEAMHQAEQNRHKQLLRRPHTPPRVRESLERTLRNLEAELRTLQEAIRHVQESHVTLRQQRQLLQTIPGIGVKLSLETLVLCYRFHAYTNGQGTAKQLVAYVGLDPQPNESGKQHKHAAISRQGSATVRAKLYFGALGGVRGHNPLAAWYHRLQAAGKAKKVALVACARKILTWVWAIFTSNVAFDPSRFPAYAPSHP